MLKIEAPSAPVLQRLVETGLASARGPRQKQFAIAAANDLAELLAYTEMASDAAKDCLKSGEGFLLMMYKGAMLGELNHLIAKLETEAEKEAVRSAVAIIVEKSKMKKDDEEE